MQCKRIFANRMRPKPNRSGKRINRCLICVQCHIYQECCASIPYDKQLNNRVINNNFLAIAIAVSIELNNTHLAGMRNNLLYILYVLCNVQTENIVVQYSNTVEYVHYGPFLLYTTYHRYNCEHHSHDPYTLCLTTLMVGCNLQFTHTLSSWI